jgi:hypothetical protein
MRFRTNVGSLVLGLVTAAGLAGVGAGGAHAMRFNPQPDPPGRAVATYHSLSAFQSVPAPGMQRDFNPQPDPPGRRAAAF